jgi:ATPase subunit of ABC transporter with duplicated ATPase domains
VTLGDRELSATQLAELFGFTDRRVWTHVRDLSGGERRRLQLLRLLAAEPNVLILDEPTNDLDTDTLAALEDLLDGWPGTLIVASHDRYLVERVCDSAYKLAGGRLTHLPGGVDEYLASLGAAEPAAAVSPKPTREGPSAGDVRQAKKDLVRLERALSKLADKEEKLHAQMAEHATDYAKVASLDSDLRALHAERAALEEEWLALAETVSE